MIVTAEPIFYVCVRSKSNPGPRVYPVVKLPDGTVTETTWVEYHASRRDLADHDEVRMNNAA